MIRRLVRAIADRIDPPAPPIDPLRPHLRDDDAAPCTCVRCARLAMVRAMVADVREAFPDRPDEPLAIAAAMVGVVLAERHREPRGFAAGLQAVCQAAADTWTFVGHVRDARHAAADMDRELARVLSTGDGA